MLSATSNPLEWDITPNASNVLDSSNPSGAGGTQNITIGLATESDSALSVAASLSSASGSPKIIGASVDMAGTQLSIAFDRTMVVGPNGANDLVANFSDGAATLTYSSGSGTNTFIWNTSRTVNGYADLLVDYTQPGNGIEDISGNDLSSFSNRIVFNDSTQSDVGTVYWVADPSNVPAASDSNAGTSESSPWATLQKANDLTHSPGDIVVVRSTWNVSGSAGFSDSLYAPRQSGTSSAPIKWKAHPIHGAILDGGTTSTADADPGFQAPLGFGADWQIMEGFEVRNCYAKGFLFFGVDNCKFRRMNVHHVYLDSDDNSDIIRVEDTDSGLIEDSRLHDAYNPGQTLNACVGKFYRNTNLTVQNNEVYNANTGLFPKQGASTSDNNVYRYNIIHDVDEGVFFGETGTFNATEIYQNVFYSITGSGSVNLNGTIDGCDVYNNTFYGYAQGALRCDVNSTNVREWNNIYAESGTPGIADIYTYGTGMPLTRSNFNLFSPFHAWQAHRFEGTQTTYNSLSAVQSGEGFEVNSIDGTATFEDAANADFRLAAGSDGIGAGSSDGTTDDGAVNMGAYRDGNEAIGVRAAA